MKGKKNGSALNKSRDIARSNYLKEKRKRNSRSLLGKRLEQSNKDIRAQVNPNQIMLDQIAKQCGLKSIKI